MIDDTFAVTADEARALAFVNTYGPSDRELQRAERESYWAQQARCLLLALAAYCNAVFRPTDDVAMSHTIALVLHGWSRKNHDFIVHALTHPGLQPMTMAWLARMAQPMPEHLAGAIASSSRSYLAKVGTLP